MPNHATRPLGEIERHYCGRCDYLFLSHGAYTLHPCGEFETGVGASLWHYQWRYGGSGVNVWQPSGLSIYAGMAAEDYSAGDILGYDDQQIVMTEIRVIPPESFDVTSMFDGPSPRRIDGPQTVEAGFRSTHPVRLGDVLCQDVGNRLRPGRVGDRPHGIVTEVHRSVTVADDDVLLRYRWEGTLVFSGPVVIDEVDALPIIYPGSGRPSQ